MLNSKANLLRIILSFVFVFNGLCHLTLVSSRLTLKNYYLDQGFSKYFAYLSHNTRHAYAPVEAIPLQAWTGPEGSRRLRLTDFKIIGT
jgi:hypothetical protein